MWCIFFRTPRNGVVVVRILVFFFSNMERSEVHLPNLSSIRIGLSAGFCFFSAYIEMYICFSLICCALGLLCSMLQFCSRVHSRPPRSWAPCIDWSWQGGFRILCLASSRRLLYSSYNTSKQMMANTTLPISSLDAQISVCRSSRRPFNIVGHSPGTFPLLESSVP